MATLWHTSRPTLIAATRYLLLRADEARLIPALLSRLQDMEATLARLTTAHNTAETEAHAFSAQVLLARAAEAAMDEEVSAFCQRLRSEARCGDGGAQTALQQLFPTGSIALTKGSGRPHLIRYNAFADRLSAVSLPALMAGNVVQILTALQTFDAALTAKEEANLRWKTVLQAAQAADRELRSTLSVLDRIARHDLPPAVLSKWMEPVRAMARRSRAAPASADTTPDAEGGAA